MKKVTFEVSFSLPPGATLSEARRYVLNAVSTWQGSLRPPGGYSEDDPGDPMFGLNGDTVRVRRKDDKSTIGAV